MQLKKNIKRTTKKKNVKSKTSNKLKKEDFPIIGIGASAGGLKALEQFFENITLDCVMAFVIIQHLDPTHVGIMPELLQRITKLKVFQAIDQHKVIPGCSIAFNEWS